MPRNFSFRFDIGQLRKPRVALQAAVGTLIAANLAAAFFVWRPIGGSAEELRQEAANLQTQLLSRRSVLERTKLNVKKVQLGRSEGDQFMDSFFLTRRTASASILSELTTAAKESRIRTKTHSFSEEPIEGSENLSMMSITGEYEGTYPDLLHYVNRIDRSQRLLIIEALNATPQQGAQGVLNISIKFDAFVREDSGLPVEYKAEQASSEQAAPVPEQAPAAAPPQQTPQPAAPVNRPPAAVQHTVPPPPPQSISDPADGPRPQQRVPMRRPRRMPQETGNEDDQ